MLVAKFAFLKQNDYEIGPCRTDIDYRGKGIYPYVLKYIVNYFGSEDSNFYMIVNENNASSRRGCEKAGFTIADEVEKTKYRSVWKARKMIHD